MDTTRTEAYLRRIGAERPARANAAALRDLHLRHLRTVPFENLSIHLGEDIALDQKPVLDKIVDGRRGGFCYELNSAFGALLEALGYRVTLLQARVHTPEGGLGIPYDHLALKVDAPDPDDGAWLVDVRFGDHSHYPIAFGERGDQDDPGGTFRIVEAPEGDLDVLRDGKPQYRLDQRPRVIEDFEAGAWYHRTSPASHFTQSLVCSRLTAEGRITLSGRTLVTTVAGERTEAAVEGDAGVLAAYRDHFGVVLERVPEPAAGQGASSHPSNSAAKASSVAESSRPAGSSTTTSHCAASASSSPASASRTS